jgi:TonB family protein
MEISAIVLSVAMAATIARAENAVESYPNTLAETAWAVSDDRGQYYEVQFGQAGTLTTRRMKSAWIRSHSDPEGPPEATEYKVEIITTGTWNQSASGVQFALEKSETPKTVGRVVVLGANPDFTYTGTVSGSHMVGEMKSKFWGVHRWTAELIKEPQERNDGPPILLIATQPDFPFASDRKSGSATIRASISPSGDVIEAKVVKASAREFGRSAATAICQWKFLPAVRSGKPVSGSVVIPLAFQMHQN